jgi:hypothetical protein
MTGEIPAIAGLPDPRLADQRCKKFGARHTR